MNKRKENLDISPRTFGKRFIKRIRPWFVKETNQTDTVRETIEELIEVQPKTSNSIDEQERILLSNVLKQHDVTVEQIMVPRADIVAVSIETPIQSVIRLLVEQGHSRVPVYRGTLDDVIGMVHIKDLTGEILKKESESKNEVNILKLMRRVIYVAPSTRVLDLLVEMRMKRTHLAVVVDEYGGIDGLVTIEDLVEQIVGDISDEHDEDTEPKLSKITNGKVLADARVTLTEFTEKYGSVFTDEEINELDTLGGVVFRICGRVPNRGELVSHPNGLEFEIIEADPRRIRKLKINKIPNKTE